MSSHRLLPRRSSMSVSRMHDRPAPRPRSSWRSAMLCVAAVGCAGVAGGQALADSGDFSVTPGAASLYVVPAASCAALQQALNPQPSSFEFELILACSIGGRPANPGPNASPCDLVGGGVNAGLTIGQ